MSNAQRTRYKNGRIKYRPSDKRSHKHSCLAFVHSVAQPAYASMERDAFEIISPQIDAMVLDRLQHEGATEEALTRPSEYDKRAIRSAYDDVRRHFIQVMAQRYVDSSAHYVDTGAKSMRLIVGSVHNARGGSCAETAAFLNAGTPKRDGAFGLTPTYVWHAHKHYLTRCAGYFEDSEDGRQIADTFRAADARAMRAVIDLFDVATALGQHAGVTYRGAALAEWLVRRDDFDTTVKLACHLELLARVEQEHLQKPAIDLSAPRAKHSAH